MGWVWDFRLSVGLENSSHIGVVARCGGRPVEQRVHVDEKCLFNVCSMFNVQCSMFNVQCSMFNVQCSMFDGVQRIP